MTRDHLIFNPDIMGMPREPEKKNIRTTLDTLTGWTAKDASFYQDVISNVSTLGDPAFAEFENRINYSRFNGAVQIERTDTSFILISFLPIFIMILILYAIHFIPPDRLAARMIILMGILFANTDFYVKFVSALPLEYISVTGYAFMGVYILAAVSVLISVTAFILRRKKDKSDKLLKLSDLSAKIIYPVAVSGTCLVIAYLYII